MLGNVLAITIPLGYVLGGLLTARGVLAHFVEPDGTYRYTTDDPPFVATMFGIFWPVCLPGYAIYRMVKSGVGVGWIVQPKAVQDRKRRERAAKAKYAAEMAKVKAKNAADMAKALAYEAEAKAKRLAEENHLPWPQPNPFIDDTDYHRADPAYYDKNRINKARERMYGDKS